MIENFWCDVVDEWNAYIVFIIISNYYVTCGNVTLYFMKFVSIHFIAFTERYGIRNVKIGTLIQSVLCPSVGQQCYSIFESVD